MGDRPVEIQADGVGTRSNITSADFDQIKADNNKILSEDEPGISISTQEPRNFSSQDDPIDSDIEELQRNFASTSRSDADFRTSSFSSRSTYFPTDTKEQRCSTKLYIWGQLSNKDELDESLPRPLDNFPIIVNEMKSFDNTLVLLSEMGDIFIKDNDKKLTEPNKYITLDRALSNDSIRTISVGLTHFLALTRHGYVYSWGEGIYGQLGFDGAVNITIPTCIDVLNNIVSIGCGYNHSVCIKNDGDIYCWGDRLACTFINSNNKLNFSCPQKIGSISRSVDYIISCGLNFTVILEIITGDVFSFGVSMQGECGHNTMSHFIQLKKIEKLKFSDGNNKIINICCGESHTIALDIFNDIYTWGKGYSGQLGLGEKVNDFLNVPRIVENLGTMKFIDIKACFDYSMVKSSSCDLYYSGRNPLSTDNSSYSFSFKPLSNNNIKIQNYCCDKQYIVFEPLMNRNTPNENGNIPSGTYFLPQSNIRDISSFSNYELWERIYQELLENSKENCDISKYIYGGIPKEYRHKIWPLLIGDSLHITSELYNVYLDKVNQDKNHNFEKYINSSIKNLIQDLPRTLSYLRLFDFGHPYNGQILEVLEVFTYFRPDIGYVQGLSYIAAIFCLYFPDNTFTGFQCLANLIHSGPFIALLRMQLNELNFLWKPLVDFLFEMNPKLFTHFENEKFEIQISLIPWFITIFSQTLPLDIVCYIWDMLFYEGTIVLFKTAYIILEIFTPLLLTRKANDCADLLAGKNQSLASWKKLITLKSIKQKLPKVIVPKKVLKFIKHVENDLYIFYY